MRIATLLSAAALLGGIPLARASTQAPVSIPIVLSLGTERIVGTYTPAAYGAWRTSYQQWEPTTVYVVDGRFYDRYSRDARSVVVYRRNNAYFLPPQERAWVGVDRRYDYKHQPTSADYRKGRGGDNGKGREAEDGKSKGRRNGKS